MKTKEMTIIVVGAVVIAGASFYGGIKYQESQRVSFFRNNGGNMMGQFAKGSMTKIYRGRPVIGEILSTDTDSMTIKQQDGSSKIVLTTDDTIYNQTATVKKEEIKTGEQVGIFGTENADGSYTAQNVQLNPQFRMR